MARKSSSAARRPPTDRRLRVKVVTMRTLWQDMLRAGYRVTCILIALAGLAGIVYGCKLALNRLFFENPDYRLQAIRLNPNEAINERDLVALTGLDLEANLFAIDTKDVTGRLLAHPAIATASVERQSPGTLIVSITTRAPRAWLACPDDGMPAGRKPGAMLLGYDGVVYPCPELQLQTALPLPVIVLSARKDATLTPGKIAAHPELSHCTRLIQAARDEAERGIGWIDAVRQANEWSLDLTTRSGVTATFGLGDHPRQIRNLHAALAHATRKGYTIATINLIPRENVPVTVNSDAVPRAIPVTEPDTGPAAPPADRGDTRRSRDLDTILRRN